MRSLLERPSSRKFILYPSNAGNQTRPRLYLERKSGQVTPLIALDELPEAISVQSWQKLIPTLSAKAAGLSSAGKCDVVAGKYHIKEVVIRLPDTVKDGDPSPTTRDDLDDYQEDLSEDTLNSVNPSLGLADIRSSAQDLFTSPQQPKVSIIPTSNTPSEPMATRVTAIPPRPLPPSGVEPDRGQKEYCTHWMRTGECDFVQQGCFYKHEIPHDPELLRKCGFGQLPPWWLRLIAVDHPETRQWLAEEQDYRKKYDIPTATTRQVLVKNIVQPVPKCSRKRGSKATKSSKPLPPSTNIATPQPSPPSPHIEEMITRRVPQSGKSSTFKRISAELAMSAHAPESLRSSLESSEGVFDALPLTDAALDHAFPALLPKSMVNSGAVEDLLATNLFTAEQTSQQS